MLLGTGSCTPEQECGASPTVTDLSNPNVVELFGQDSKQGVCTLPVAAGAACKPGTGNVRAPKFCLILMCQLTDELSCQKPEKKIKDAVKAFNIFGCRHLQRTGYVTKLFRRKHRCQILLQVTLPFGKARANLFTSPPHR